MLTDGIALKQRTHFRINHMNFTITFFCTQKLVNKIIWFWRLTLHQFFKVNDLFKTCYLDKTYYNVENFQTTGSRISLTLILKRRLQIRFSNPLRICVTDSWRKSYLYTDSWSDSLVNVRTPAYSLRSYKGRSGLPFCQSSRVRKCGPVERLRDIWQNKSTNP